MRAIASPAPGTGFSPREFARSGDSAYLIGKKRASGSMAPFFAVLATEVFEELKWFAMETPAGCLPVPATFVLDEMPLTCPWAVHDMLAECRGYKITLTMGIQSLSQLRSVWGKDDGDTIRSATPVEVVFGGEKRAEDLEALSVAIGNRDTWHHVKGPDGRKTRQHATERLMPPEALRNLPKRQAVILAPACKPVLAATPAIWERRGHVRADLSAVFPATEQLAIEAPRKPDPIAPPYRPPAVTPAPVRVALTDEENLCVTA
jgi:type IV secretory pathway TraG/TraD family ATPase VirD4